MHQLILGTLPPIVGDHINHQTLDNRRTNLRAVTDAQNRRNKRCYSSNTSGYKGVSWSKKVNKWVANIMVEGKYKHLGYFADKKDAARAYDDAAIKHHGEFSYLNFPH